MVRWLRQADEGISGLEILLDERICEGEIWIEKELLIEAGGINSYLQAKQKYELLIRLAFEKPIVLEEAGAEFQEESVLLTEDTKEQIENYGWQTDCYVTGRYSEQL